MNKQTKRISVVERLDRFLASKNWFVQRQSLSSQILPFSRSDHFSIDLNIEGDTPKAKCKSTFKFQRMWFRHPQFLESLSMVVKCTFCRGLSDVSVK